MMGSQERSTRVHGPLDDVLNKRLYKICRVLHRSFIIDRMQVKCHFSFNKMNEMWQPCQTRNCYTFKYAHR